MKRKGLLIAIEKVTDGLGGSTQAQLLAQALQKMGIETLTTREPGGTEVGEQLRNLLLNPNITLSRSSELLLFMVSRAESYEQILKPALNSGKVVICDRFIDSTLTYQGAGRGWSDEVIHYLHDIVTESLYPDITFVLYGKPHRERSQEDRFERLGDSFFKRVEDKMWEIVRQNPHNHCPIYANQPPEEITKQMVEVLQEQFPHFFSTSIIK